MRPTGRVERIGFRRWHERELYRSFAWLTSCLVGGIAIGVLLEAVGLDGFGSRTLVTLFGAYVAGLLIVESFRRFWATLARAQQRANGATCGGCGAYGLFDVHPRADEMSPTCRRCGHRWTIR